MKEIKAVADAVSSAFTSKTAFGDPVNMVAAISDHAQVMENLGNKLGFGGASTRGMGAMELASQKHYEGMELIARAINNLAEAIREGQE